MEQDQKILKWYSRDGLRRLMKLSNGGARLIVGWPGIASRWLFFVEHYSCYGPLVTTVAMANDLVPAKHSPGKDNACYSSSRPPPNVGPPW